MNQPRSWTTPLLTGTFLLVAATGVLMFFHAPFALVHPAHEWLSWRRALNDFAQRLFK